MKLLIAIIMTAGFLFSAEPVASVPSETPASENVVMVGFERYRDFELVSQSLNCGAEKDLRYYVVASDVINRELLPEFLKRVKKLYPYVNFTSRELREYWTKIFSAPIHVFVFCGETDAAEEMCERFSRSDGCRDLVARSLDTHGGFMWMGIMSVIEDRVKTLLGVASSEHLIATVFFGDQTRPYAGHPLEAR